MSYDYRVTVREGSKTADGWQRVESFDEVATRPALAVGRALDAYQRAHKGDRILMLTVTVERLGVHKRPPCAIGCTVSVPLEEATGSRYGTHYCGRQCTGLENHRDYHRCEAHKG